MTRDRLIPPREFGDFMRQADFSQEAITRFAECIGIAPGIVVGRLQHEGWLPHSHCNALKIFYDWK